MKRLSSSGGEAPERREGEVLTVAPGGIRRKLLRAFGLLLLSFGLAALIVLLRHQVQTGEVALTLAEQRIEGALDAKGRSLAAGHGVAFRTLVADNAVTDMGLLLQSTVETDPDIVYGAYIAADRTLWAFASRGGKVPFDAALSKLALTEDDLTATTPRRRVAAPFGQEVIEFAVPVFDQQEFVGTLRYGVSREAAALELGDAREAHELSMRKAVLELVGIVALILVSTLVIAARTAARIAEPVIRLTGAVKRLARGERSVRVDIRSGDEIETLGSSFNTMAADLDASCGHLEEANRKLVAEVEERQRAQEERTKLERHLLQAQKMEAIGQLAAGVAHDFNNILMAISGSVSMLELMNVPEEATEDIGHIHEAVGRGANLTRQLLMFSRSQEELAKLIDPNELVVGLDKLIRRLLPEQIRFEVTSSEDVPCVFIDPGRLEQVVINLVINARDAVGDNGSIRVATGVRHVTDELSVATGLVAPGDYVQVEVADDGCGIDSESLPRVFEPFFSTKRPGRGTGLGLSTAHGIVSQAGGYIDVTSTKGEGTTFRVLLPVAAGKKVRSTAPRRRGPQRVGIGETVLLCEDDPVICRLVQRILTGHGYRVVGAERPSALLRRIDEENIEPRILVTDVLMPEKNGKELAAEVRKRAPDLKVLYISGHPGRVLAEHGVSSTEEDLLSKPFTADDILERLAKLLGRSSTSG
jgi:signal transduction histidine kinase/ActR/RegA family two-component response regulator